MSKNTKKRAVIYSNVKANKRLAEEKNKKKNEQINLNDEVIIGFNSKKKNQESIEKEKLKKKSDGVQKKAKSTTPKKEQKKVNKKVQDKNEIIKSEKVNKKNNSNVQFNSENEKSKIKRKIKIPKLFKIAVPVCLFVIGAFAFLKSSVFNIKRIEIHIENNSVITTSEIRELSQIFEGQNMFSIKKWEVIESIKNNAYVENVKIKRKIPDKLEIDVIERVVMFQLQVDDGYIYVDQNGIILDKQAEKKDCVLIVGYKTSDIVIGNKVNDDDIKGLSDVMSIIQEAENNGIMKDITKIDISNHDDYIVHFDSCGKLAHIGDVMSINDKMARVAKILDEERDYEGEIFVNVDFNNGEYSYFREKV